LDNDPSDPKKIRAGPTGKAKSDGNTPSDQTGVAARHGLLSKDACTLDPNTKQRVGPSGVATIILVLFTLSAVANVLTMSQQARIAPQTRITLIVGSLLSVLAIYMYYAYYSRCRPWTGWFLFVVVTSFAASVAASPHFTQKNNNTEDEDRQRTT
jgi:hypothetical protein